MLGVSGAIVLALRDLGGRGGARDITRTTGTRTLNRGRSAMSTSGMPTVIVPQTPLPLRVTTLGVDGHGGSIFFFYLFRALLELNCRILQQAFISLARGVCEESKRVIYNYKMSQREAVVGVYRTPNMQVAPVSPTADSSDLANLWRCKDFVADDGYFNAGA
jgi:hypothetical protein